MFIDHLKTNYNFYFGGKKKSFDNWDLVYALRNNVGIHNGKFPKYFQREIMNLFNDGAMSTLFCTSTIVEGVNTNAKTVCSYYITRNVFCIDNRIYRGYEKTS